MTSVRESLNVVGQTVSIKELAHQRNASFPLSLREFVGALPPGRMLKKEIPLDFLQRKFDEFFNNPSAARCSRSGSITSAQVIIATARSTYSLIIRANGIHLTNARWPT